jgi:hypothetical protein
MALSKNLYRYQADNRPMSAWGQSLRCIFHRNLQHPPERLLESELIRPHEGVAKRLYIDVLGSL